MSDSKHEQLKGVLREIERRWGPQSITPASAAPSLGHGLATGIKLLDHILQPGGVPLQAITLLSGATSCGKLTLAYKTLVQAQRPAGETAHSVAILDIGATTDADYLVRCGLDLERLLIVRPTSGTEALRVLLDLVRSRELRAILFDSLPDLMVDPAGARGFDQMLPQLNLALKGSGGALILLDEIQPPWLPPLAARTRAAAHYAALQIELTHEGWMEAEGELVGYRAQARVIKARGAGRGQSARVNIQFGAAVRSRETW